MSGPWHVLEQWLAVTRFSLGSIPARAGAVTATVVGIAGVVAVWVGTLSIGVGFRRAVTQATAPDMALVLRGGADSETVSALSGEEVRWVAEAPGVQRHDGRPLASAELVVIVNLPQRRTGTDANVVVRGVQPAAFAVRDALQVVAGRRFEPGRNEVLVGRGAAGQFAGLEIGERVRLGQAEWTVVGHFTAGGGLSESELWVDAFALQTAYQRGNSYQSLLLRLESPAALEPLRQALVRDPRLNVKVLPQDEFYAEQTRVVYTLVTGLGSLVAGLMGLGAVFGALNTMYSAVAARTREMATLRALGFGRGPVVASVLAEALVLGAAGGSLGGGLAWLALDGYRTATMNWQSFSQVTFAFEVRPALLLQGLVFALAIGMLGGLLPAVRAARLPVVAGLREA